MKPSIGDFLKLDLYSKSIALSVAVLMPFWYLAIYIYDTTLYQTKDYSLLIVISFCCSVIWWSLSYALSLSITYLKEDDIKNDENVRFSGFIGLMFLLVLAFDAPKEINTFSSFFKRLSVEAVIILICLSLMILFKPLFLKIKSTISKIKSRKVS